jgi:hypothetical protein
MGNQELYFLGYEDMDEFKNYHNDFAELFINKPGYIFKFKNFSWIDYTLHSGTPNKKVIVKTKNGKEVETALIIHEIFLDHPLNGATMCYCIELNNTSIKAADLSLLTKSTTLAPEEITSEPLSTTMETPHDDFLIEDAPDRYSITDNQDSTIDTPILFSSDTSFLNTSHSSEIEEEIPSMLGAPKEENSLDFKLKIDHEILQNGTEPEQATLDYQSIDDITLGDLSFVTSQENYREDDQEDLLNDTNLFVEESEHVQTQTMPIKEPEIFDLSESAEKLGLDISTIALIIGEYSDELTIKMETIEQYLLAHQFQEANQEIVKLKSIALNLNILSLFDAFTMFQKALEAGTSEENYKAFMTLKNAVIDFKDLIQ